MINQLCLVTVVRFHNYCLEVLFLLTIYTQRKPCTHLHAFNSVTIRRDKGKSLSVLCGLSFHALTDRPNDRMRNPTSVYLQETDKSCHIHKIPTLKDIQTHKESVSGDNGSGRALGLNTSPWKQSRYAVSM